MLKHVYPSTIVYSKVASKIALTSMCSMEPCGVWVKDEMQIERQKTVHRARVSNEEKNHNLGAKKRIE